MDYLFFDIECASCKDLAKICEFGYVLVDDDFNVLQTENLLINPECEFEIHVLKKILNHRKSEYLASPKFKHYFGKIKSLLTRPNTMIVGHTVKGDVEYVSDECIRHNEPTIDCEYVDVVEIVKKDLNHNQPSSLAHMCEEYGIPLDDKLHSADVDAKLTMLVAKKLCEKYQLKFSDLALKFPDSVGVEKDYSAKRHRKAMLDEYKESLKTSGVKLASINLGKIFKEHIKMLEINADPSAILHGKTVSYSDLLETIEYKRLFNLVRLVAKHGGRMVKSQNGADVFVKLDKTYLGEPVYCRKEELLNSLKYTTTQIVNMQQLAAMLGENERELDASIKARIKEITKILEKRAKDKKVYGEETQNQPLAPLLKDVPLDDEKSE